MPMRQYAVGESKIEDDDDQNELQTQKFEKAKKMDDSVNRKDANKDVAKDVPGMSMRYDLNIKLLECTVAGRQRRMVMKT